ncbi:hypothetical protein HY640_01900 [Candidatus Woesearchaeota archaeon]|nr:hypothetical protein [Candidatus Woesearchaeota archaeon]
MEQKTNAAGKRLPEKKFRAGAVTATIWKNDTERGSYATVNMERSYKDGDTWKSTSSLRLNDLPKAALVLNKAYEYLLMQDKNPEEKNRQALIEEIM